MTGAATGIPGLAARAGGWLRGSRAGLFAVAVLVGAGSGLAVAFRYLIYFFTWLAAGHDQFGQAGYTGSAPATPAIAATSPELILNPNVGKTTQVLLI